MKRVTVLLAALLLVLATAAPAAAAKPVTLFDEDYDTGPGVADSSMCGFDVTYHGWGHASYREWQDATGFPIRGLFQAHGWDSFTNPATGTMVAGKFHASVVSTDFSYDAATGIWTFQLRPAGVFMNIQLPGEGIVFHEAGQYRWFATASDPLGSDQVLVFERFRGVSHFDVAALCEALAE